MKTLLQNTMTYIIVDHTSRDVWITPKELFEQLWKAGYHFTSFPSFVTTFNKLKCNQFLDTRKSPWPGERVQYRRAANVCAHQIHLQRPSVLVNTLLPEARL